MNPAAVEYGAAWSGPRSRPGGRTKFTWAGLLWSLVYPQRGHRFVPTLPGMVLIGLSLGIGTAAYNSSSNILFITLSLLLACLILSGLLSWLNLRGVAWRVQMAPPLRAGHDAIVALELRNRKKVLPTYGLWFEFSARSTGAPSEQRAESTVTAKNIDVRAVLKKADQAEARRRVPLGGRLDAQGEGRVEWIYKPEQRGVLRIGLAGVGSMFPFGFLRKEIATGLVAEAIVWPAPIEYRRHAVLTTRRVVGGERMPRPGMGGDLLALRRYATGDSHRLIHWKASARTGQLLVRQFAAESAEGFSIWLRTDAGVWPRPEQFETLISFAATLAEDLFRAGRLQGVAIDAERPIPIRRVHDLELFLDQLAILRPVPEAIPTGSASPFSPDEATALAAARQNVMTFAPDGVRGVVAYVDGQKAASA